MTDSLFGGVGFAGNSAGAHNAWFVGDGMWDKLRAQSKLEEENYILASAARIAQSDKVAKEFEAAKLSLASIGEIARRRAENYAFMISTGTGANGTLTFMKNIPASYKDAFVTKAYWDAFDEGMMMWGLAYPYVAPLLKDGNFLKTTPSFGHLGIPTSAINRTRTTTNT